MSNPVIRVGIDLGTTNSAVAINVGGTVEIVKKAGGVGYTPSVFGFNKSCNRVVGQTGYQYLYQDASKNEAANYKSEIKRLMGTPETVFFERAGVSMSPEEISAEILKSLKADILKRYRDFETVAAVITVPAAFSVLQSEATKRAGEMAGFKHVILLQEPIAAASSYGFQNSENANWLVYDLGGGTFDTALISCKDGILSVLGHSGDNFLGGKNIDWDIVDTVIAPKISEKYLMVDFARKNPKFKNTFLALKYYAEKAKMELSLDGETEIEIEDVKDDKGNEMELSITLSRRELEDIIKPTVNRTVELVRATLNEAGVKSSSVEKIILVGGATQMPYVRERLESEFNIKTDASVDPLTAVAHGACVFGMSKQIPKECLPTRSADADAHNITLNYSPMTSETEEPVTGTIDGLDSDRQFYVQIQSVRGTFSGPKTKINKAGKFYYPVTIEPKMQNDFWVFVFDQDGNRVKTSADSFTITHGLTVSGAPVPHSLHVVIAERDFNANGMRNRCELIFEKGSTLPLTVDLDEYKTSKALKRGEDSKLDIRLVEGESENPDRNGFVCEAWIRGTDIPHDIPQGTDVRLTVEYNESRQVGLTAYVPLIDMTFKAGRTELDEKLDMASISREFEEQLTRIEEPVEHHFGEERGRLARLVNSIERGISNSGGDEDEKRKAHKQLKELKIALDRIDEEKTMPKLVNEHNSKLEGLRAIIDQYSSPDRRNEFESQFEALRSDGQQAIKTENKVLLAKTNEQIDDLQLSVSSTSLDYCAAYFQNIVDFGNAGRFTDETNAQYYTKKGHDAINRQDITELNRCIYELTMLLPRGEHVDFLAGIMR